MALDSKRRSSLDDAGVASSALRRLTQTPRLGLRRPGTISSSSSSISSIISHDHEEQTACVYVDPFLSAQLSIVAPQPLHAVADLVDRTRETSQDECALNRFLVWAAVKRNSCEKMTPEERRECPLLRCRKRFPNHELMLQHLYGCEELAAGEYWCYDCTRVERFSDSKCKRCLGHPSKRRKMLFMAKNFFSSLGHRSKTGSLPDLDLEIDEVAPSYDDSFDLPPSPLPQQAELQSTEIHEIDSYEVSLEAIIEDVEGESLSLPLQTNRVPVPVSTFTPFPRADFAAELESANLQVSSQPTTVAPANLSLSQNNQRMASLDRPMLQVQTTDLARYREEAKRRSKLLAPSSSVRSTASTNSTNSTASSGSYAISPMSTWSGGGWGRVPGFESTMTSPADDVCPSDAFASSQFDRTLAIPNSFPAQSSQSGYSSLKDSGIGHMYSTELPADMPMMDGVSPQVQVAQDDSTETSFPMYPAMIPSLSLEPSSQLQHDQPHASGKDIEPQPLGPLRGSAHSLVTTAWGALEMHVNESMERLKDVKSNDLVEHWRMMSPELIAFTGLKSLVKLLSRIPIDSAVDLLCFVHLAYSFSLIIHEQEAPSRAEKLFSQAVSYASWLSESHRREYLPVVDVLWKPRGMSTEEVNGLIRKTSIAAKSRSKGKQPQFSANDSSQDSLLLVAQSFLDAMEDLAIHDTERPAIQASELCIQHMKDMTFNAALGSEVEMAMNFMHSTLSQQFAEAPNFVSKLSELRNQVNSSCVSTIRRLELMLLNLGRLNLHPHTFFDNFAPCVRIQIDSLHSSTAPQSSSRLIYHQLGVRLIESIIPASASSQLSLKNPDQTDGITSIDDFIQSMSPTVNDFDFSTIDNYEPTPFDGCGGLDPNSAVPSTSVSPNTNASIRGPSTVPTTPSQGPTPHTSTRLESDSYCEICGYRPEGDPRWFSGSMAKHKKLKHTNAPPKIYYCPWPGCESKYTNRPDNLRQHQLKKGHFVDGDDETQRRPSKRRKVEG